MKILVLGAGVTGVTTAYRLAERGHDVTVVEGRSGPAEGTSRANAGLITPSQAPPWNEPGVPRQALKWLFEEGGALVIRPRPDPALWGWLLRFVLHSRPALHEANARTILALARHSRAELDRIAAAAGIAFDRTDRGILTLVRGPGGQAGAERTLRGLGRLGIACSLLDRDQCLTLEPALAPVAETIDGAIHTPEDCSGDIYLFVTALARAAAGRGVRFHFDRTIETLRSASGRIAGIVAGGETMTADRYVLALGPGSRRLAAGVGIRLPIYPVQGLSVTLPTDGWRQPPTMPVRDRIRKVAITPFGKRLRVAGMAILDGGSLAMAKHHLASLRQAMTELFPTAPRGGHAFEWSGLRPMTPDGPPIVGPTGFDNLYLNTGHGPLGWTLACGSADVVADMIEKRPPAVPVDRLGLGRYRF